MDLEQLMNVILILHVVLVLVFTIRILLRDDLSPPARLAWFVVLNVLPYIGSVIYFCLEKLILVSALSAATMRFLLS